MFETGGGVGPAEATTAALAHATTVVTHVAQQAPVTHSIMCAKDTLCFQIMQGIPAAMVALAIGIIGSIIAWRQYATARAKLKLDLFTRRYELFIVVWDHLSHIKQLGAEVKMQNSSQQDAVKNFRNNIPQAGFLFGPEMERYLDEIDANHLDLWELELKVGVSELTPAQAARKAELEKWFDHEARTAKDRFKSYLDLREWK